LQQSAVLEAINRVFHETLTCESDEEVARTCLVVAEALTGSQFGFIDEVNPAGRVDAIALSDPGWEACRLPKSDAVALLKDMEIRSIWARVIKDGQSIIVNDPASHPDSVGTPERHPPLTAFLGIPLKYGGQTIGLIGLANKEGGYDVADQEAVEALSVAFVESLHLKRAEEALRESENTFRRTFEAIPDPAYLWERQTDSRIILTAANKAAFELSGGRITDLIGTELGSPNIPHYSYSGLGSTLKHVLDTGETRREEMRGKLRSTGEQQWFLVDYAKMAEENVLMITKDITTRKQAEKTLAKARDSLSKQVAEKTQHLLEEKNRVETIIETIPEGLLVFDMDGTLSLANKTAKEYYWNLYHEELPVGYNCLKRADNIVLETVKKIFLAQKGEVIMIEPKPGLHLQFSSAVTRVPGELPFGTIIEVRDISPFINFDTMRKQFVSSVSHELRTPISAIVQSTSNIEKYKKRLSEAQQDQLLDIISRNATLMAKLIDDLLLVSRIDEHRITVEWRKYRPLEILQDVLTELESGRKAKAIAIHVDVDKEIQLLGDRQKIGQIFRIFLDNALKYSYEQTAIKVKVIDHYKGPYNPQARDGVLLQFHDSGRGIREKDMSFLFERFFRSEDVREIPGTGLGLAIAQELTGLHEGEIFVESEFGKGSIFSVFLPRLTKLPLKL
ncbi:MAG: ATP-binding protein, partial [Candidatus Binatia bacterium]